MSRSSGSFSWLPGFLRRFLNLDDEMPDYGPGSYGPSSSYSSSSSYTPPSSRPAQPYAAPEPQRFTGQASYTPADPAPRFAAGYTPAGPPPPAPRSAGQSGAVTPGANLGGDLPEGYVQPVGYLLRSYARGALPPQGLEQFTRETRATTTDVWNFYSYWTRFQTEEIFRIGRELFDTVFEDRPAGADAGNGGSSIRRIKVTTANGDEKPVAQPVPVSAAPPAPPAPTVVFSEPVTADDAAVPPAGDKAADFMARVELASEETKAETPADEK